MACYWASLELPCWLWSCDGEAQSSYGRSFRIGEKGIRKRGPNLSGLKVLGPELLADDVMVVYYSHGTATHQNTGRYFGPVSGTISHWLNAGPGFIRQPFS